MKIVINNFILIIYHYKKRYFDKNILDFIIEKNFYFRFYHVYYTCG